MKVPVGVVGEHNILNSLSVLALMDILGIDSNVVLKSLADFHGTDRRFEYKGTIGGVTILDDYAHHPTEITATLKAARQFPTQNTLVRISAPYLFPYQCFPEGFRQGTDSG